MYRLVSLFEGLDVTSLAHSFLEAITGEESWQHALARMADSFGGIESHFTVWDRAQGCVLFSARAGRFPADANVQYARYFHQVDTCKEALIWSQLGDVMLTQDHYGEAFVNTEIYHDFLRPLGARYVMGVKLADRGPAVSMLRIHRSAGNGPYSGEDVRRLNQLFPELSRSARLYFNQQEVARTAAVATAALDHLQIGVIVIDRDRRILHANAAAERMLATGNIMTGRAGRLSFDDLRTQSAMRRLIASALTGPGPLRYPKGAMPVRAGQYEISVSPLQAHARAGAEAVLLTFKQCDCESRQLSARLQAEFGLTVREAAIANQIVAGRNAQEIAALGSVSLNTVKTHLRAVFAKMNVHSQSDLVRIALRGGLRDS
jgi:DNA-binding CsgD family transcriptional regulator